MKSAVSRAAVRRALAVDVDVVLGQPGRERDVGAEDHDVVEAEAPDAHLLERAAAAGPDGASVRRACGRGGGATNQVTAAMTSSRTA